MSAQRELGRILAPSLLRTLVSRTILVSVVPLLVLATALLWFEDRVITERFDDESQLAAKASANAIQERVRLITRYASLIAEIQPTRDAIASRDPQRIRALLLPLKSRLGLDVMNFADIDGRVIGGAQDPRPDEAIGRELLERVGANVEQTWVLDNEPEGMMLRAVAPVRATGQLVGIVEVGLRLDSKFLKSLQLQLLAGEQAMGGSPQLVIIWDDAVTASTRDGVAVHGAPSVSEVELAAGLLVTRRLEFAGERHYAIFTLIDSHQGKLGLLGVFLSLQPVEEAEQTILSLLAVLVVALVAVVAILAYRSSRELTRPLTALAAAATRIQAGDLRARIVGRSPHEIGTLEESFDRMAHTLEMREREQQEHLAEAQMVNAIADAVIAMTQQERVFDEALRRLASLLGASGAAIVLTDDSSSSQDRAGLTVEARLGVDADTAARVAREVLPDLVSEPAEIRRTAAREGARGGAHVSLLSRGELGGVLSLYFAEVREITPTESRVLHTASRLLSVARANANLVAELEVRALYDSLTGLPNRTLVHDRLRQSVLIAKRNGSKLALLLLDLDNFKEVNDSFGHQAGDALLPDVGRRLVELVRAGDTVGRLGGDEFALVLPGADSDGAIRVAQKVREALERPFYVAERAIDVTGSVGIVVCPDHGEDELTLLRYADIAMYSAKRSRNSYHVYRAEEDHADLNRLALVADLRRAIEHNELTLHYQPILSLRTGRVRLVEALARWEHPQRGQVSTSEFIPLAEQTGLIQPLTEWALRTAVAQCRAWHDSGRVLPVSVNISARQLLDPDFPKLVITTLEEAGLDAGWLGLEVTESVLVTEPARAIQTLARLRDHGIGVAIDDFGVGYSSLAYLQRLPITAVKIDKSFITRIADDESSGAIVRAIIELTRALRFGVVAEGVEDERAWHLLKEWGCHTAQGFWIARPMSAATLERWFDERGFGPSMITPKLVWKDAAPLTSGGLIELGRRARGA